MATEESHHEFRAISMAAVPSICRLWARSAACSISADSKKNDIENGGDAAALEDEDGIIPTVVVQRKGLRDKSTPDRGKCVFVFCCLLLYDKTRGPLNASSL